MTWSHLYTHFVTQSLPEQMLQKITGLLNVPQQLVLMCHSSHSCMLGMQYGCLHCQQCSHPVWAGHWSIHVQYHVECHNQKWSPTLNPCKVYWSYWFTKHWALCSKFWIDWSVHHLMRLPSLLNWWPLYDHMRQEWYTQQVYTLIAYMEKFLMEKILANYTGS